MKTSLIIVIALALLVGFLVLGSRPDEPDATPTPSAAITPSIPEVEGAHAGALHGRITTLDGAVYEGRLRFGGDEEAFWRDYMNGTKDENPWVAHVPVERLPRENRSIELLGFEIARREREIDLARPFMARFGDIARIEARGTDVRVTLKSGTVFALDRLEASDFDDGVRVWDARRGVVDLDSLRVLTLELLPPARPVAAPYPLHGTVRTRQGDFTGFLQWNREKCVGSDELRGRTVEGELRLRFDTLRSITRRSNDSALATLLDGQEIELSKIRGQSERGIYVDDRRYGRVLVSWDAFERVDFSSAAGSGPTYDDFPPGRALTGGVTTRDGRRLAGRLVYDLDESETTETLDAPSEGVDYTIPFGLIASIVPPGRGKHDAHARVTLRSGEELRLERAGDLGDRNAGMLIFSDGRPDPEYVPWADVERIDLE